MATVPSLQTVGVVVCQMPLVGPFVVPLTPIQYFGAAKTELAKHSDSMAMPTFESRQTARQNDFLFGNTQHFRSSGKPHNSDKDMNASVDPPRAQLSEYRADSADHQQFKQGKSQPALRGITLGMPFESHHIITNSQL